MSRLLSDAVQPVSVSGQMPAPGPFVGFTPARPQNAAGIRTEPPPSVPVASGALVLEVTGADDPVTGGLLLALAPDEADRAISASGRGFAIVIRPS